MSPHLCKKHVDGVFITLFFLSPKAWQLQILEEIFHLWQLCMLLHVCYGLWSTSLSGLVSLKVHTLARTLKWALGDRIETIVQRSK